MMNPYNISEINQRRLVYYETLLGKKYFKLIQMAAVPLLLSPDLLYQIWRNFKSYLPKKTTENTQNNEQSATTAISDILLSSFCHSIGFQLYKIEEEVRSVLVSGLSSEEKTQIALFLKEYAEKALQPHQDSLKQIHLKVAKSILNPADFVKEIKDGLLSKETKTLGKLHLLDIYFQLDATNGAQDGIHLSLKRTNATNNDVIGLEQRFVPKRLWQEMKKTEKEKNEEKIKAGWGYQEALRRIEKAVTKNATKLDLYRLDLTVIPKEVQEIRVLEELDLRGNQIIDISPLSSLTYLRKLHLENNQISDISFLSGLTNLWNLSLGGNQISDISFLSGLTNLGDLHLENNQIRDISFLTGLTNLEDLHLENNQIRDISFLTGLTNLGNLHLENNQIRDISFLSGLTNLWSLSLGGNQIRDISYLSGLTNLGTLALWNNQISNISFLSSLTNLRNLHLENNQISNISPLSSLTNLRNLHLENNKISDISPLSSLTNLEFLDLTHNQISKIEDVLNQAPESLEISFENRLFLDERKFIKINDNPIQDCPQEILAQGRKVIEKYFGEKNKTAVSTFALERINQAIQKNATELDLSNLGLTEIPSEIQEIKGLEALKLSGNEISDISPLKGFRSLQTLNLDQNQLTDIRPLAGLVNLERLSLFSNQIKDISALAGLTNLTELDLNTNGIKDISSLSGLTNLNILKVSYNNSLDLAPLSDLTNLVELTTSKNNITNIGFLSGLTNLKILVLGQNLISDFSILAKLKNLSYLNLDETGLSDISILKELNQLTYLNLTRNKITKFPSEFFDWFPLLEDVRIYDNPIGNVPSALLSGGIGNCVNELKEIFGKKNKTTTPDIVINRITEAMANNSTELDLSNLGLTEIPSEIQEIEGLETLILFKNNITDISFLSILSQLKSLNLSYNKISNISYLAGLTNLTLLNLHVNNITDISPLNSLTNLTNLYLGFNKITNIASLNDLANLKTLHLSFNEITNIGSLGNLVNLKELGLTRNGISDIFPLSVLSGLQVVKLGQNNISDISPLKKLINLIELELYSNKISDIEPLQNLTNLEYLTISSNEIADIIPVSKLNKLKGLGIANTMVNDLFPVLSLIMKGIEVKANQEIDDEGRGILVKNCPLVNPPMEVVVQGHEAILRYFSRKRVFINAIDEDEKYMKVIQDYLSIIDDIDIVDSLNTANTCVSVLTPHSISNGSFKEIIEGLESKNLKNILVLAENINFFGVHPWNHYNVYPMNGKPLNTYPELSIGIQGIESLIYF